MFMAYIYLLQSESDDGLDIGLGVRWTRDCKNLRPRQASVAATPSSPGTFNL